MELLVFIFLRLLKAGGGNVQTHNNYRIAADFPGDFQPWPREWSRRATFHFYAPFNFTHQGADWVSPIPSVGVKWPGDNVAMACQAIRDEMDFVRIWSRAHGNIPVLLGEFGALSKGDITSRANWTAYVRKQAESMGISWTYWEFCAKFGVYDDTTGQWNEPLLEALGLNP